MGDLLHSGNLEFVTGYVKTGNVQGIQANPVGQYTLNSLFGKDKNHTAFFGVQSELGLYLNENTDNIVHFNHGTELFTGVDLSLSQTPVMKVGTKIQFKGGYHLFNGELDKQFGVSETVQNSYYFKHKDIGANLDINYKYKNYGNYSDGIIMNPGRNYGGVGLRFSFKPESSNIELFAGSNVEFPIKKKVTSNEIEGEVSVGIMAKF